MPVKIYIDELICKYPTARLFPLLKNIIAIKNGIVDVDAVNKLIDKNYLLVQTSEEADILMLALEMINYYNNGNKYIVEKMLALAQQIKKPLWYYTGGDYGVILENKMVKVFLYGGNRSTNRGNKYAMPFFIADPIEKLPSLENFEVVSTQQPKVGFCGREEHTIKKHMHYSIVWLKHVTNKLLGRNPRNIERLHFPFYTRFKALEVLRKNENIISEFVLPGSFNDGDFVGGSKQRAVKAFQENIAACDYIFCMRGIGNYSLRFYETLACGRIPVFLNTDCNLPLGEIIDWKKHVVWVEEKDLKIIDQKLVEFHKSKTPQELEAIKKSNRQLWLDYLRPQTYFTHLEKLPSLFEYAG